jgi:hypothetical protein
MRLKSAPMASVYNRSDSPYIWISYKDASGKWRNSNSGYRKDNVGDRRQAELVAREKTLMELTARPVSPGRSAFAEWTAQWIEQRWGHKRNSTLQQYRRCFLTWQEYLTEIGTVTPAAVTREIVPGYGQWRKKRGTGHNTVIHELKFIAQIMEEAVRRGYARENPARKLGLQQAEQEHTPPWKDEQIKIALAEAEKADRFGWLHVALLMGYHQAVRLQQSAVPLNSIDLEREVIEYPGSIVKGGKPFTQSIYPEFLPILAEIVAHRRQLGESRLCSLPKLPSLQIRWFLDGLGFKELSHHGLRVSWITRAALAGFPESVAMRFANHASREVHAIYQRIGSSDVAKFFDLLKK